MSGNHIYQTTNPEIKSIDSVRIIDVVCEGEIGGLVNGDQSIYFNETPLRNPSTTDEGGAVVLGDLNFDNVAIESNVGTQVQGVLNDFESVESGTSVGTQIKKEDTSPPIITINQQQVNPTSVRVALSVPVLFNQTNKGELKGTSIKYEIHIKDGNSVGFTKALVGRKLRPFPGSTTSGEAIGIYGGLVWWGPKVNNGPVIGSGAKAIRTVGYYVVEAKVEYAVAGSGSWIEIDTISFRGPANGRYLTEAGAFIVRGLPAGNYDIRVTKVGGTVISGGTSTIIDPTSSGTVSGTVALTHLNEYIPDTTAEIRGRTTSGYIRNHVISLSDPGLDAAPWNIKFVRLTDDSNSDKLKNDLYLDSYTEIVDRKLSYPNTALFGVKFDASQFGSLPTRSYDLYLLKIKIPSNYDPVAKTYSGIWDGTFITAWSDNPAWCFYDLVTNKRFGLGAFIDSNLIDAATIYTIGKYCDELVPTGRLDKTTGDPLVEPRFTCNLYIQTREEAYKVLTNMASIFRGMIYWSNNLLTLVQDAEQSVFSQFTNADVINGEFNYEGSAAKVRRNVALVTWNDPENGYRQSIEYVEDSQSIALNGVIETEIVAVGCTSRGQARRLGLWILYTEQNETETVTFKTGLEGSQVSPGKIIHTSDQHRAGVRHGGRIISVTASTVTLDSPLTLGVDETFTLTNVLPDGSLYDTSILNPAGVYTTVNIDPPFPTKGWDLSNITPLDFLASESIADEDTSIKDIEFSLDGTKMYFPGGFGRSIYQYTLDTPWDISGVVTYDTSFDVSGEDINPVGIRFSSDGLSLFLLGKATKTIYRYSLLVAWDLTSPPLLQESKVLSTEDSSPEGVSFSIDGLKMFIVGTENTSIYEYSLNIPWGALNTATLKNSMNIVAQESIPSGISFSIDGLKMFVSGFSNNKVFGYTLESPWDLSSNPTYVLSNTALLAGGGVQGVTFSSNGSKMFVASDATNIIYEYPSAGTPFLTLPDEYSIWVAASTSISPEEWRVISVTEESPGIYGVTALEHNSSKYKAIEQGWDLEEKQVSSIQANTQGVVKDILMTESLYQVTSATVASKVSVSWEAPRGAVKYVIKYRVDEDNTVVYETRDPEMEIFNTVPGTYYVDIVAYNSIGVASLPVQSSLSVLGLTAPPTDVSNFEINVLGENSYLSWTRVEDLDLDYYQIRFSPVLSGATWLASTILVDKLDRGTSSVSVPSLVGTYLIKAVDSSNKYSINAASIVTNIRSLEGLNVVSVLTEDPSFSGDLGITPFADISTENLNSKAFKFNSTGTKMYVLTFDVTPKYIKQYTLKTAFSISSATWDGAITNLDISTQCTAPVSFEFNALGTKLYVLDDVAETVYQYTLSTAYLISTATYDNKSFISGTLETTATSITLRPDGREVFLSVWDGLTSSYIYSFPLSVAWDISSASTFTVHMDNWGLLEDVTSLSANEKINISSEVSILKSFIFSEDGTRMLTTGSDQYLRSYTLKIPWSILTLNYDGDGSRFDVSTVVSLPEAAIFSFGGSNIDFLGTSGGITKISVLNLAVGYELSSASFGTSLAVLGGNLELTDPNGINTSVYTFANSLDLGDTFTSRVTPSITVSGLTVFNFIGGWVKLSDVASLSGINSSQYDVALELRTTEDDPMVTPLWSTWKPVIIGDYSARAFEFRLRLTSLATNITPSVSKLSVAIDMPDRVYGEDNLISGAGVYTVIYTPAFKGPLGGPALAISAQELESGDYYEITNKTVSGFDIAFKDTSNILVSRTFDYVAKGYGYVLP